MAGYIGSKTSVVSSGVERKKTYSITGSTTSLTGLNYTVGKVHVYQNGVRLLDGTDYTATNGTSITLTVAAQSGDNVVVVSQASFQLSDHYTKTASDARYVNVAGDSMTGALNVDSGSLKVRSTSGSTLELTNTSTTLGDNAFVGGLAFRNDDTSGSEPHYAGIKARTDGSGGTEMDLEFYANRDKYETDAPHMILRSTGNLGIGTISPSSLLTIHGSQPIITLSDPDTGSTSTISGNSGHLILSADSGNNASNNTIDFQIDNSQKMRIDSSGRVMIGTTTEGLSDGDDLTVSGSGSVGITIRSTSSGQNNLYFSDATSGAGEYAGYVTYEHNVNAMRLGTNGTERMRIDSSGNVGIGTSSPNKISGHTMLSVNTATATQYAGVDISTADAVRSALYANNGGTYLETRTSTPLVLGTNTTERMRLDGAGKVGIGTSNPIGLLSVVDSSTGSGMELQPEVTSNTNRLTNYNRTASAYKNFRLDALQLEFQTSGNERMRIDSSGRVTMPYQPYFFAHRTGSNYTETASTAKVLINGTRFNNGGHFDTTNNRFVAPLAGAYQFNASVNCYGIADGNQFRVFLRVNGTTYAIGDSFHSGNSAHDLVASISHVIYLSANDYVEVWSFSDDASRGFSQSPIWNTFSGHLIG